MARIFAMRIRAGKLAFEDVPERWTQTTREEYESMYGEELM